MFQLTDEEISALSRSQNVTLNKGTGRGSNIKYNPYAFTEQGIYMLMTVLRDERTIKQRRALMRTLKQMKDGQSSYMWSFLSSLSSLLLLFVYFIFSCI